MLCISTETLCLHENRAFSPSESMLVIAAYMSTVKINIENLVASSVRSSDPDSWHPSLIHLQVLCWRTAPRCLSSPPPAMRSHQSSPLTRVYQLCGCKLNPAKKHFLCGISELMGRCDIVRPDATEVVGLCSSREG